MKHLIIYAHPNPQSLNGQLKHALAKHLSDTGQEVVVRDLYQLGFNPVLSLNDVQGQLKGQVTDEIKQEQAYISWANCLTFIHPIWWTGLPAIVKGYIERVFSYGFAYRYDQGVQKGLLSGKQVIVFNTQGKSHTEYQAIGMDKALLLTSDWGIYKYCGLEVKQHLFFEQADKANAEIVAEWTKQIKAQF